MNFRVTSLLIFSLLFLLPTAVLAQQGVTAFNYQGQIFDAGGQPVTGQCDFVFQIFDAVDSPAAIASLQIDDLAVTDGLFSVSIDFGTDVFDASPRWLETAVRCGSDPDFDSLGRQQILSVPYATYAYGVDWANIKNRPEYTAGAGLALSGTEFSIPTPFQLPQGCADNEIPKWTGSRWLCASDLNSDTLATLSCEEGQIAVWNGSSWLCGTPGSGEGTTYTAGTGLALAGTEFSIPTSFQLPQGCAGGERASWTGSSWACTRPVDAYAKAEVDTALASKIDATEVYTTAEIDSQLAAVQTDLAGKIDTTDVYTTGQVDRLLASRAEISHTHTAVATATVALAVDWSDVTNIPAGLADETDNIDDTVSWSEISGLVGTSPTNVAGGNHNHDTDYYTQGQVDTALAGKIDNTEVYTTGQVDAALAQKLDATDYTWSGLSGVPSGFSDDTDDTNDTVSWSEISGIVGTGATNVAGGSHNHDTDYVDEGQTDSITSAMVTDGSITSADLQDGAALAEILDDDGSGSGLDADKLDGQSSSAFATSSHNHDTDYYTQGQVDTALALKIDSTEVYTTSEIDSQIATVQADLATKIDASEVYTTGQVDAVLAQKLDASDHTWSGLAGVPSGFSDDTDDTDDTVSWSEISGLVGTGTTEVAGGSHNHDTDYYTQGQVDTALAGKIDSTEVYTTGQVDAALAQKLDVSDHTWSGLSGVPSGFSDDTDDINDTVSWPEISGIVGTGATNVAGGSHNHDTAYVNEGQSDSITSAMVTDGSITSADLQDGAALAEILDDDGNGSGLDADKLDGQSSSAFATSGHNHDSDYYTQGQVDTALALKIDGTEVYTTGQVDAALAQKLDASDHTWSGLAGVPAGFSDDTDDTDDTVSWPEISGIVGTGATNVAGGSHNHDTAYVNEGQTDSITSAMVTDGSITSADLQDGAALAEILDDDGAGSGLDADKLDGQSSSAFATSSHNHTYADPTNGTGVYLKYKPNNTACSANQVLKWDATNSRWICGTDSVNTGDITGVTAGSGLTGGGTSGSVTLDADFAGTGSAATIARSDHNHDTDYVDEGQANSVTSAMVTDGSITSADLQDGAALAEILDDDGAGSTLDADTLDALSSASFFILNQNETVSGRPAFNGGVSGSSAPFSVDSNTVVTNLNADKLDGQDGSYYWSAGGNAATSDDFIGTTNSEPLVFKTNNLVGLRIDQGAGAATDAPAVIGGYLGNTAIWQGATIAGGGYAGNVNSAGYYGSVGGGYDNVASGDESTIGGGWRNQATAGSTTIGGGFSNTASGTASVIGGGNQNTASAQKTFIGGGESNTVLGNYSAVMGGESNQTLDQYSTVAGGFQNTANYNTFIGGGWGNVAYGSQAVVVGGHQNVVSSTLGTVVGGTVNVIPASGNYAFIGGGMQSTASGDYSFIGSGYQNAASGSYAAIGGGANNTITTVDGATVGGGAGNTASGTYSTIGGGAGNTASGNLSTIPGGNNNTAAGASSFAAGRNAQANHDGSFVWGDNNTSGIASNANNSVTFRAAGGYRLFTNNTATAGASLAAGGGSWASMSDRHQKENLEPVDTQTVLEQVGQLPLSTWNYISQEDDTRHIGPMAQDFHAAFGVGENETTITAIDGDGVSLAAIQALYERVKALEAENEAGKARLDALEARLNALTAAVQGAEEVCR